MPATRNVESERYNDLLIRVSAAVTLAAGDREGFASLVDMINAGHNAWAERPGGCVLPLRLVSYDGLVAHYQDETGEFYKMAPLNS
jgi:hypothetical protein